MAEQLRRGARTLVLALFSLGGATAQAVPWTFQVRDAAGHPLADAVVAVLAHGKPSKTTSAHAEMGQRNRQFTPQLLVVQTGTAVAFPNYDSVRHQVYSFSPIKVFELKLYAAGTPTDQVFDKPGVATLACNIHDRMHANIVVVDTPLFATTDASGTAHLDLPPGEHQLQYWHEQSKNAAVLQSQPLNVGDSAGSTQLTIGG
ncbi:MAG: methylamine utilization protein [Pelomonas sp.]|nr:methylamine utilization protein [Roseateles sp.]